MPGLQRAHLVGELRGKVVDLPRLIGHIEGPVACAAMHRAPRPIHIHKAEVGAYPVPLQDTTNVSVEVTPQAYMPLRSRSLHVRVACPGG